MKSRLSLGVLCVCGVMSGIAFGGDPTTWCTVGPRTAIPNRVYSPGLEVIGDTMFVCMDNPMTNVPDLISYDITDPLNPVELDRIENVGRAIWGKSSQALLIQPHTGPNRHQMGVVDVRDPSDLSMTVIDVQFDGADARYMKVMAIDGDLAYMFGTSSADGLTSDYWVSSLDLYSPASPSFRDQEYVSFPGGLFTEPGFFLHDEQITVSSVGRLASSNYNKHVFIDVSDPDNLTAHGLILGGSLGFSTSVGHAANSGEYVYSVEPYRGGGSLVTRQLNGTNDLIKLSTTDLSLYNTSSFEPVIINGDRLFIPHTQSEGVLMVDISDRANPRPVVYFTEYGVATSVRWTDTGLFVGTNEELQIGLLSDCSIECVVDLNEDLFLNFIDVSMFLNLYRARDLAADLDENGTFNFQDVSLFLNIFASGCTN